jgi:AcrR family transcriptional regulator
MTRKRSRDATRDALIATALELFTVTGYDRTSVEAILARSGLSKGAFYHHFASKEAILDAAIERLTGEAVSTILAALNDSPSSALGRFNAVAAASRRWRWANLARLKGLMQVIYRDENLLLRHKMNSRAVVALLPILHGILAQGVNQGVFQVDDPEATARLLLELSNVWGDLQAQALLAPQDEQQKAESVERRSKAYTCALERILGLPRGTLAWSDRATVLAGLRELKEQETK